MTVLRTAQVMVVATLIGVGGSALVWFSGKPSGSDISPVEVRDVRLILFAAILVLAVGVSLGAWELGRDSTLRSWNNLVVIGGGAMMTCLLAAIGLILLS